jgi:hypothetical protein
MVHRQTRDSSLLNSKQPTDSPNITFFNKGGTKVSGRVTTNYIKLTLVTHLQITAHEELIQFYSNTMCDQICYILRSF